MNIYRKYILPRLINTAMQNEDSAAERAKVVPRLKGVVLEIGFGSGLNLPFYGKDITKLYAIDPSRELWELAAERVNHVSFPVEYINASAEKIPLADNTVDTVLGTWTLCSIPHPPLAAQRSLSCKVNFTLPCENRIVEHYGYG